MRKRKPDKRQLDSDQVLALVGAQQDQDIANAKEWCRGSKPGHVSLDVRVLWDHATSEFDDERTDMMARFALIGLRHVMQLMAKDSKGGDA